MQALPPATPVATPEASTVAIAVLLQLQVPPVVLLLNEEVVPAQNTVVPVIAAGALFTVICAVILQPLDNV